MILFFFSLNLKALQGKKGVFDTITIKLNILDINGTNRLTKNQ